MIKKASEKIKEDLCQYDYYEDDYIEKVYDKYSKLIGAFMIKFSELEHELNIAIAETFFDDDHSVGYRVIKNLNFINKIELFYEIHLEIATHVCEKDKINLKKIRAGLDEIRIFRNQLVHANWQTLTKKGFVRTKIDSDKNEGNIQFINIQMLPKTISKFTNKVDSLTLKIWSYKEK